MGDAPKASLLRRRWLQPVFRSCETENKIECGVEDGWINAPMRCRPEAIR
ncbi:hypothetical protein RB4252 [Rhodopirellula baltica SH 1]|uniref:Uncharacterized protein n=1 Tax=Rhodopirellula baltica (strain DSM 10527 / NCIMB 13988 / SH1) TaxID=243090 RepID=Q7USX2_RHOBA|nr:hypothetical protein RB4252 [Rhodopirellula baltica SH 1]